MLYTPLYRQIQLSKNHKKIALFCLGYSKVQLSILLLRITDIKKH